MSAAIWEFDSKSGDVQLENFALDGSVRADSFSGDLSAAHVSATGELAMEEHERRRGAF